MGLRVRTDASTFRCLVQVCLAELRGDVGRLFESGWAEPERARALELASVLRQACERQGLRPLAYLAGSLASLAELVPSEAEAYLPELRKRFKELFLLAEQWLSRQRMTG